MTERPFSVGVLGWLSIVFGVCGGALLIPWMVTIDHSGGYHFPGWWYSDLHPLVMLLFPAQLWFLAVCGAFMLRGFNWSRWMFVAWVVYHIFQSIAHTRFELMFEIFYYTHSLWELLAHMHFYIAILLIVFTPSAHKYFRTARAAG